MAATAHRVCQGRSVAIKRILIEFYEAAQKEIELLIESDEHPSVLRYYAKEQDTQFVYLALALCPMSLADLVAGILSLSLLCSTCFSFLLT